VSTPYYDIYIDQVFSLAETLVIYSSATADAMNNAIATNAALAEQGIVVIPEDNTTWKYHMNLQGLYHPSDTPMSVVSLDTLQTIAFTVANLQSNRATARAYVYGSSYFNALVELFPNQENLILGVLDPVKFFRDGQGQIIVPDDGTILWFDPQQIEPNETNLIAELQKWIYVVFARWNVAAYTLTDDLYAAAQLGILFSLLPSKILNIRLANCKTRFVHSFHVREYLASNGNLDRYVDSLTTQQKLWLYRNIQYIKRNAGKQSTFKWLVQNILTNIGLPLAEWNFTQSTFNMPGNLLPTPQFSRNPLNFGFSVTGNDVSPIATLFDLEVPLAKDNLLVESDDIATATELMANANINELKTKVLESSVLDLTDAQLYTLSNCLLNQWMYWAYSGRYNAVVNLHNPHTGNPFNMPVLDAFIVYLYAYNKANGITLEFIPQVIANHVQRIPQPTIPELEGITSTDYLLTTDLYKVLANLPASSVYISTDAFYAACLDIQAGIIAGRALYVAEEELNTRAQMEIATQRCYCDVLLPLDNNVSTAYADWLQAKGYVFTDFTNDEWQSMATTIIEEATGVDLLNVHNLKDLQASMLALMTQLSSYSIQYIQSINNSKILVVDWNAMRVGAFDVTTHDLVLDDDMVSDVLTVSALQSNLFRDDQYSGEGLDLAVRMKTIQPVALGIDVRSEMKGNIKYNDRYLIPTIEFSLPPDVVQTLSDIAVNVVSPDYVPISLTDLALGFTSTTLPDYSALTSGDHATLVARFLGILGTPIGSALHNHILDGLSIPYDPNTQWPDPFV
jgi:hypothetical protein